MKNLIMIAMSQRINKVRDNLSIGWHNPELMEDLECLQSALRLITNFEAKLKSELDDID